MMSKTINITAPTKWNDMTPKQVLTAIKYGFSVTKKESYLILMLQKFANIKLRKRNVRLGGIEYFRFKKGRQKFLLTAEEVKVMTNNLKFLLRESTLKNNPLPELKTLGKKLYGPANNLYNITLSEFIFCEINFVSYCKSNNVEFLNNLIAILWRPQVEPYEPNSPSYTGDRRECFNDSLFIKRARRFKYLKLAKKLAIFNYYAGSRNAMQSEFPMVYSTDSNTGKPINMAKQMTKLISAVNQGDPTKNKTLEQINIREILTEINSAAEIVAKTKK